VTGEAIRRPTYEHSEWCPQERAGLPKRIKNEEEGPYRGSDLKGFRRIRVKIATPRKGKQRTGKWRWIRGRAPCIPQRPVSRMLLKRKKKFPDGDISGISFDSLATVLHGPKKREAYR